MENQEKTNAGQVMGIVGLILGIIALIVSFIPCFGVYALVPGVIAIVLSVVGLSQAKKGNGAKGLAIAALVVSSLATIIAIVWLTLFASAGSIIENNAEEIQQQMLELEEVMEEAAENAE